MTRYEWVIETVDEYEDIREVNHADTLTMALLDATLEAEATGMRVDVGLVRDALDNIDGSLKDRQWAYLEDGKLPEQFDGGASIPQRFKREVEKARK